MPGEFTLLPGNGRWPQANRRETWLSARTHHGFLEENRPAACAVYEVEEEEGEGEEEEKEDEGDGNGNGGKQRFYLLAWIEIEDVKHDHPDGHGLTGMAAVPAAAAGDRDAPNKLLMPTPLRH